MKTQNTVQFSEIPAFISSVLMDKQHDYNLLFSEFMSDANKAYLLLVLNGSFSAIYQNGYDREFCSLIHRLGGFVSAVCYIPDMHTVYKAFSMVIDILYEDFEEYYSACFAAPPPDSAVLENVAVEVTQGATNLVLCQDCLAVEAYTDDKHNELVMCSCGGVFCGCESCNVQAKIQFDYDKCIHEYDNRGICVLCSYNLEDEIIAEADFIDAGISPARVSVQPIDSFFDPLPLSAYADLENKSVYVGSKCSRDSIKVYHKSKQDFDVVAVERAGG